jgi:TPR repeat protein
MRHWTVTGMRTGWLVAMCLAWVNTTRAEVWDRRKEPLVKSPLAAVQQAAEAGDPMAQKRMGDLYLDGEGVAANPAEAVRWYRLAGAQGLAPAQHNLGNAFMRGQGVPKNAVEGARWYQLAARQNLAQAQYALGFCHLGGEGVPPDYNEGIRFITLAAEQGLPDAQQTLGDLFLYRPAPDYESAFRWYRQAAAQNRAPAQMALAACYENGLGVKPDPGQALTWYDKAAAQGSLPAKKRAALMRYENKGLKPDYREAEKRLLALARELPDDVDILFALGYIYFNGGHGVARAPAKALPWYQATAERGYAHAQHNLAIQFETGDGAPRDPETAYACYLLAAGQGLEASRAGLRNLQGVLTPAQVHSAVRRATAFRPVRPPDGAFPPVVAYHLRVDPATLSRGTPYSFTLDFSATHPQGLPEVPVEVAFRILQGPLVLYESKPVRIMARHAATSTFTKRDLPCNAPPGIYEFQAIVRNGPSQTDKTVQFTVR